MRIRGATASLAIAGIAVVAFAVSWPAPSGHPADPSPLVASARAPASTRPARNAAHPTRILYLGDSNLQAADGPVRFALAAAGLRAEVLGVGGLGLKDLDGYWLPVLRTLLPAVDPGVVVVGLGTNDAWQAADTGAFRARLDELMQAVGDRRVVWVTHFDDRPEAVGAAARTINHVIRAARGRWPNLAVLDLAPLIDRYASVLLVADRLHFSSTGQAVLAREVATAAREAGKVPLKERVSITVHVALPARAPVVSSGGARGRRRAGAVRR